MGGSSSVARSKYKNAPGNKTDIGWKHGIDVGGNGKKVKCKYCSKIVSGGVFIFKRHLAGTREYSKSCATVLDEIKLLMMKIVAESKAAKEKKNRLNSIDEDEESAEGAKATNFASSGSGSVQATLNQLMKKKDKPLVNAQVAEFFYTSVIPFNAIKNPAFLKMCEMIGKYGLGYKTLSCHDVREKMLKQAVQKTDDSLQEFRDEWKRTNTSNISKTTDKVFKMLDDIVTFVGEENVVQLITDNDLEKHLKVHEVTIKQGRKITTYIYGRTMLIGMLKKYTNGRNLVRPGMTRFATAYLNLARSISEEWKKSKFETSQEGRKVEKSVLDSRFWKNVFICLKVVVPLMVVLQLVDSDQQPARHGYEPVWEIIDKRWENQLYRPLHAAAYYLNPQLHFEDDFIKDNGEVKEGLFICTMRLVKNVGNAKNSRKTMPPAKWWEMFRDGCPKLKWFTIRVLSLTYSSSGYERNWSSFEMVHTKRRNRLHLKKMNDLVYVMYNLKLKSRQTRKIVALPFEDMESDDEWITEEGDEIFYEDNLRVEQKQPLGERGSGSNIDLVGGSLTDPTLDAFDIDNLVLNDNVEDHFSTEEKLEDDGGGGDIGDDFIRGLMDI
ncbi:hypothetical protein JHK82_055845 [Glycine max]|nr:hypothetical protein JHK86_055667 [Glycine max]KAG4909818.1 hypothetical protein JHK87_055934 [Glycine soja]KAG4918391.1 hypothetical protein JHK85_056672 [Glycine max]KAG5074480.1 hypothetical protein JHK84_055711 [Glycine max]KAG5077150.1 hypothetical protein JHK82_055845 [Glycine max]